MRVRLHLHFYCLLILLLSDVQFRQLSQYRFVVSVQLKCFLESFQSLDARIIKIDNNIHYGDGI